MPTVTVVSEKCIRVEMVNTAMQPEKYWIDLRGVYVNTKSPILDVTVSRSNGSTARLNNNVHRNQIGRVCSAARKEISEYVRGMLAANPQGGWDNR